MEEYITENTRTLWANIGALEKVETCCIKHKDGFSDTMDEARNRVNARMMNLLEQLGKLEKDIMHLSVANGACGQYVDCRQGAEHARIVAMAAIRLAAELQICADEIKYVWN